MVSREEWQPCALVSIKVQSEEAPVTFLWSCLYCSFKHSSQDDFVKHFTSHRTESLNMTVITRGCRCAGDSIQTEERHVNSSKEDDDDDAGTDECDVTANDGAASYDAMTNTVEIKPLIDNDESIFEEIDDFCSLKTDDETSGREVVEEKQRDDKMTQETSQSQKKKKQYITRSRTSKMNSSFLATSVDGVEEELNPNEIENASRKVETEKTSRKVRNNKVRSSRERVSKFFRCSEEKCNWWSENHFSYHRHVFSHLKIQDEFHCQFCRKDIRKDFGKCGYGYKRFRCRECDDVGPMTRSVYERHVIQVHRQSVWSLKRRAAKNKHQTENLKKYKCNQCSFATNRKCGLTLHSYCHETLPDNLKCDHCEFITDNTTSLKRHVSQMHKDSLYKVCSYCSVVMQTVARLKHHLRHVHSIVDFSLLCCECGVNLKTKEEYERHTAEHNVGTLYVCSYPYCEFASYAKDATRKHQHDDHHDNVCSEVTLKCDECDFKTSFKHEFKMHKVEHMAINTVFFCQFCMKTLENIDKLNNHIEKSHQAQYRKVEFQCRICGKFFENKLLFLEHQSKEHGIRELYVCEICGHMGVRKGNIIRHKEVAHKKTDIQCNLCDYHNTSMILMDRHYTRLHQCDAPDDIKNWISINVRKSRLPLSRREPSNSTGNKMRGICVVCGKNVHCNSMKKHMEQHDTVGSFQCNSCTFSSSSSYSLAVHVRRKHSGALSRVCSRCGHMSKNASLYQRHLQRKHPELKNERSTTKGTKLKSISAQLEIESVVVDLRL